MGFKRPQVRLLSLGPKIRRFEIGGFFIYCESNGISSPSGVYHQPKAVYSFATMIYKTSFDDMQSLAELM